MSCQQNHRWWWFFQCQHRWSSLRCHILLDMFCQNRNTCIIHLASMLMSLKMNFESHNQYISKERLVLTSSMLCPIFGCKPITETYLSQNLSHFVSLTLELTNVLRLQDRELFNLFLQNLEVVSTWSFDNMAFCHKTKNQAN